MLVVLFEIWFKKDYYFVGCVFVFDLILKNGVDFELKVFMEYFFGLGNIYNSVLSVVK